MDQRPAPRYRRPSPPIRRRRGSWRQALKSVLILGAAIQPLVIVAVWAMYARSSAWEDWLSRLGGGFGKRPAARGELGSRVSSAPGLAYYGGGRVALGDYSVKVFNPVSRVMLRVDFALEGDSNCPDAHAFNAFAAMHHNFFREQVMVSVRSAPLDQLTDPELSLLKRNIVARVNLALGEPFLNSVDIKEFSLFESVDRSGFVRYTPESVEEIRVQ